MTIEEKARAYDEALDRCKEWASGTWGHSVDDSPKEVAEFIFPQLVESEDERIRRALIDGVRQIRCKNGVTQEQMLAYLEKQKDASKAIEAVDRIDKYIDEHVYNAHDMKDSNPDKKYYRGWDDALGKMAGILQDVYSVEKQKESLRDFIDDFPYSCEQKEPHYTKRNALFDKCVKNCDPEIMKRVSDEVDEMLEKEQKSTEIDEYKIIKKHITEDSLSSEVNKRLKECGWYVTDTESSEWSEDVIRKAVKEVGLTQHQIDWFKTNVFPPKQEWNDEDEGELQNAIDALEFLGKKGTYKSESGYDAALQAASWLKSFRLQLKLDWSKEDKVYLEDALWCVKQATKVAKDENGMGACWSAERWLKSLSERFTLQPKPEWNEKDEKMFSRCIKSIESSKQFASSSVEEKDKEINWLKSLPERFSLRLKQERGEEDEYQREGIIQWLREYQKKFNPKYDSLSIESIESLINWFKSLRSSWKPTKEQMDALRDVIETVPMTCRQQVPLESLYSDLNKNL